MMQVSVVICSHNPRRDYLKRTLQGLRAQTLPRDQWELLLVDNASKDALANEVDLNWHPYGRHVLELELGLTQARLSGIRESSGELLVYADDDNVLEPDYLEQAVRIAASCPQLGCFGAARIIPEFEKQPETALLPYTRVLALRDEPTDLVSSNATDWSYPFGAGLVVRRAVADTYLKVVSESHLKMQLDRRGDLLNSCGDDEFSWIALEMGLRRGVFRSLVVKHLISASRVEK